MISLSFQLFKTYHLLLSVSQKLNSYWKDWIWSLLWIETALSKLEHSLLFLLILFGATKNRMISVIDGEKKTLRYYYARQGKMVEEISNAHNCQSLLKSQRRWELNKLYWIKHYLEGNRGWDGWMASLTQWTWVWAKSRRWWRTGKPGMLSMGPQRVRHNLATEQQQSII